MDQVRKPCILHTEASDGWGGQEIRILAEMAGMKGRGYTVLLAAPEHSRIFARAREAGIESFPVAMDRAGFIGGVLKIAALVRKRGVAVINTHSSRDSWMGSMAGLLTGVPVVRYRHISSRLSADPLTRLVYNRLVSVIVTTGNYVKDQLASDVGISADRIVPIPTGIDVERFARADGAKVRESLGIGLDEKVLGVAAVLRSWKGHEHVVRAMPEVIRSFPGTRLVLAGEGPMRPYIEGWARELGVEKNVVLLGHREDMPEVIASFDISVLDSFASEGIPQFLIQSMAAGKPVIGSTAGGIPEVVQDGVTGLLVPPKDPGALAVAAVSLLSDPGMMARMGEAGRKAASGRFTAERMLDDVESLYGRFLG